MFNRLDEKHLCLWPLTKLLTNSLLNPQYEVIVFGGRLPNHTLAGPFSVVGKALDIISSRMPWRWIVVLNVAMWSQGSRVLSYESKVGILNLEGKGWLVMDGVKGESVLWTRSSTWLVLLMESLISSMAFFIWSITFSKCGTLQVTVPLDWSPHSALLFAPPFFEFYLGSSEHRCRRCFFLLTSLVNSWFYYVKSTIVAAMDCPCCWTDAGIGASARFWWQEAFPFF